ncbi:uncharacterized protein TNCV_3725981 [Trichonephila clavipes]|nr:uncharacterized protein TNCV_3725981 [Trichonephila clavipes]
MPVQHWAKRGGEKTIGWQGSGRNSKEGSLNDMYIEISHTPGSADINECAYCNPRTLLNTMKNCTRTADGIPNNLWTQVQKRCILRTCRQQHPSQKILPTLFPIEAARMKSE